MPYIRKYVHIKFAVWPVPSKMFITIRHKMCIITPQLKIMIATYASPLSPLPLTGSLHNSLSPAHFPILMKSNSAG